MTDGKETLMDEPLEEDGHGTYCGGCRELAYLARARMAEAEVRRLQGKVAELEAQLNPGTTRLTGDRAKIAQADRERLSGVGSDG